MLTVFVHSHRCYILWNDRSILFDVEMRYFGYWSPVNKDLTMILRILQNNDETYENLMIIFLSYFLFYSFFAHNKIHSFNLYFHQRL